MVHENPFHHQKESKSWKKKLFYTETTMIVDYDVKVPLETSFFISFWNSTNL